VRDPLGRRDDTWSAAKSIAERTPVVVAFDENASTTTGHFVQFERVDPARRAADARKIVGDAVAFVAVDRGSDAAAMPPTNVVVDGAGRVLFASDDLRLVGAAAERLIPR
jgi:hypothetical protein